MLRHTLSSSALILAPVVALACSDSLGSPVDVRGNWSIDATFSGTAGGVCLRTGNIVLQQDRSLLAGTLTLSGGLCPSTGAAIPADAFVGTWSITSGSIRTVNLRFDAGDCSYTGRAENAVADSLAGPAACTLSPSQGGGTFTGSWYATVSGP